MLRSIWNTVCLVWDVLFTVVFIFLMWPVLIGAFGVCLWMVFWDRALWDGSSVNLYLMTLTFFLLLVAQYYNTKTFMILGWFR